MRIPALHTFKMYVLVRVLMPAVFMGAQGVFCSARIIQNFVYQSFFKETCQRTVDSYPVIFISEVFFKFRLREGKMIVYKNPERIHPAVGDTQIMVFQ